MVSSAQAPGLKEIPIPPVLDVPTYAADYLPTYREAPAYVRGRGGTAHHDPRAVEYDLDDEDRAWLGRAFNSGGQARLPPDRLEAMLWRLEVANAAATDTALAAAGALVAERSSTAAAATTDHLPRPDALAVLARVAPLRTAALTSVYEYWTAKRARAGRPLLRRLRAPTAAADTNPYHVFRPREKAHRPQTRRRRENAADAVEKIRALGVNLGAASALLEGVLRREARKAALAYVGADTAALALSLHHDPPAVSAGVAADAAASIRVRVSRRPPWLAGERGPGEGPPVEVSEAVRERKRRRAALRRAGAAAVAALPPAPPPPPSGEMLFAVDLVPAALAGLSISPGGPPRPPAGGKGGGAKAGGGGKAKVGAGGSAAGAGAAAAPSTSDGPPTPPAPVLLAPRLPPGLPPPQPEGAGGEDGAPPPPPALVPRLGRGGRLLFEPPRRPPSPPPAPLWTQACPYGPALPGAAAAAGLVPPLYSPAEAAAEAAALAAGARVARAASVGGGGGAGGGVAAAAAGGGGQKDAKE